MPSLCYLQGNMRNFHMIDSERVVNDVNPPLHPNQPRPQQSLRRYHDRSFHGNQKTAVQPQRTAGVPRPCNCGPKRTERRLNTFDLTSRKTHCTFFKLFPVFLVGSSLGRKHVCLHDLEIDMFETLCRGSQEDSWNLFSGYFEGPSQVHNPRRWGYEAMSAAVVTVLSNYETRFGPWLWPWYLFCTHLNPQQTYKHCAWYQNNLMIVRTSVPLHNQGDGSVHSSKHKALPKPSSFTNKCKWE